MKGRNLPTTVSSALADTWSKVVLTMQVYSPSSLSVTSEMTRLSEPKTNLKETQQELPRVSSTVGTAAPARKR